MNKPRHGRLIATFGKAGSGKSTACRHLSAKYDVSPLSPGNELRSLAAEGGPAGREAQRLIDSASPVPDDMLLQMLSAHTQNDLILDGIPRNVAQVALVANFARNQFQFVLGVHLVVTDQTALDRISRRSQDAFDCREDDLRAEVVKIRLRRYESEVLPAAAAFAELFPYEEFDASSELDEVTNSIEQWISLQGAE